MIDNKIDEIARKIKELEEELATEFKKKEEEFFYKIENEKIRFEEKIIKEGRLKIISSLQYLSSFSIATIMTIPFIWSMIIPAFIADMIVSLYQLICFPIYKIPKVKRKDYVIMDRYNLFYLGKIEKINCLYCEYFNGVISYTREVAARTEQYWCPIKHAKSHKDMHSRYSKFFDYGDYVNYREKLSKIRKDFENL